ncbi:MAG TPA: cytochrome D1 domain-containing protein [Gammaproteobacteria bacterium]|nr:cytochrome D1 domain-containing protein [Gammaproteobacteria bacterium]
MFRLFCKFLILLAVPGASIAAGAEDIEALYGQHCAACHGAERLGNTGPALLPENLGRLKPEQARATIADGRPATQMPAFRGQLEPEQIAALVEYIYRKPVRTPAWGAEEIAASHRILNPALLEPGARDLKPVYDADPLNLFLVVEAGDHHVTVLDGDRFAPLQRFESRRALHGGPKYSSDGRYVYLASRDGWITKYDMYRLEKIAEVRAGINTRNAAVSADDRYVMVGNYLPHTLVVLDARDLGLVKIIPVTDRNGEESSRVSAVYTAAPRDSFIVALKDLKEVWEISYLDDPPPVFNSYVHDFRMGEGLAEQGGFPVRRIALDDYLDDFFFDPPYRHLIGTSRSDRKGQVVNLIVGRKIASIDLEGMPHLGSGISWDYRGRRVMATPNLKTGVVSVIDMQTWQTIRRIETLGPGFFMRSHENSRYAWVDVFFGPNRDAVQVIDKQSLEIVKTLRPAPGKTSAHVEFTRDGKYALLSIWDTDGAVIVYDADTLEERVRIPMNKPVGKYNVYNKINRSEGTSH